MTINYIIEGPKGVGKSTLAKKLKNSIDGNVIIKHFDSTHLLDMNDMNQHRIELNHYIYDRGYLSYLVYGWVQNYHQSFKTIVDHDTITLKSWSPLSREHFIEWLNNVDDEIGQIYIMYASDWNVLKERISKREKEIGKGATSDELEALEMSNTVFKHYAYILEKMEEIENKKNNKVHKKIIPIDICKE